MSAYRRINLGDSRKKWIRGNYLQNNAQDIDHDGGFAEVETVGGHRLSVTARETRPAGERVSIGIRPQHITLADGAAAGRLDTRVTLVEELGSETVVHADASGKKLIAVFAGQQKMKSGDSLPLHLDPAVLHLFAEDGRRLS